MRILYVLLALLWPGVVAQAQPTNAFPLWPEGAPGALGQAEKDTPTLTPFLPAAEKATGAAFIICPGGGYGGLAEHEGKGYALWFNEHGAGRILEHDRVAVASRAETILEDKARDAVLIEPQRVAFAFVLRQAAVASAGANDERRAGGLLGGWQKRRQRGCILFGLAQRAGRPFGPKGKRIGGLRLGDDARPKQSEQDVKNSHPFGRAAQRRLRDHSWTPGDAADR